MGCSQRAWSAFATEISMGRWVSILAFAWNPMEISPWHLLLYKVTFRLTLRPCSHITFALALALSTLWSQRQPMDGFITLFLLWRWLYHRRTSKSQSQTLRWGERERHKQTRPNWNECEKNLPFLYLFTVWSRYFGDRSWDADENSSRSAPAAYAKPADPEGAHGLCHKDAPLLQDSILERFG